MKLTHTLFAGLLVSGTMLASEPFLLKTTNPSIFNNGAPSLFSKKESALFTERKLEMNKQAVPVMAVKKMGKNADDKSNIAVKLNVSQLALLNLSFQAEYGFHPKMSVALGYSRLLNRNLGAFYSPEVDSLNNTFKMPTLKGYAVTPEFRFYPGANDDKPAPRGFYIGAYLRFAKYKISQEVSYTEKSGNKKTYTANSEQTYGGYTAGLMIGRQWIIGNHFTIDWWIVGGGYGKAKYTYEWVAPGANLSAKDQADVKAAAEDNFNSFSALGLDGTVTTTSNSAKMTVSGLRMVSIRFMGLCLGYSF